jgi:hypothetical protein
MRNLAERGVWGVQATLDDILMYGASFTMSNATTVNPDNIRAPLGTKITVTGGGVISIAFPFQLAKVPKNLETGWAWMAQTSSGVGLAVVQSAANVLQLTPASALGASVRINVLGIGPEGVHTIELPGNTAVSKLYVGNVAKYGVETLRQNGCFLPVSGSFTGGQLSIDSFCRRIIPTKVATGIFDLDIGTHKFISCMFALTTGLAVAHSMTNIDKTVRIQMAADPANGTRMQGFIFASWSKER